jgi:hypothetical protein
MARHPGSSTLLWVSWAPFILCSNATSNVAALALAVRVRSVSWPCECGALAGEEKWGGRQVIFIDMAQGVGTRSLGQLIRTGVELEQVVAASAQDLLSLVAGAGYWHREAAPIIQYHPRSA